MHLVVVFEHLHIYGKRNTLQFKGVDYLSLYGEEPSAIEMVFAIYINVLELDEEGNVLNNTYAQQRATDYLKQYCLNDYTVEPEYENWEIELHGNTYP